VSQNLDEMRKKHRCNVNKQDEMQFFLLKYCIFACSI